MDESCTGTEWVPNRHEKPSVNCHSDFVVDALQYYYKSGDTSQFTANWHELRSGGVDGVFCAVGGDGNSFPSGYDQTLAYFKMANELAKESGNRFKVVRSMREFERARREGNIALFLGLEGCHALEGRLKSLETFHQQGLCWLSPTWNFSNELGDGCGEERNGGVTPFGKTVISMANELGIVVDLVHASQSTFYDAVAVCRAPFIVSHSNASSLCPHPRNITDEQIRLVARNSGVIGANFFPRFLSEENAQWRDIERHIRYIMDLVGPDHVALGPDFIDPTNEGIIEGLIGCGVDYGGNFSFPRGFSDNSCFPSVAVRLAAAGFGKKDIDKIIGENILRVFAEVQHAAALTYNFKPVPRRRL